MFLEGKIMSYEYKGTLGKTQITDPIVRRAYTSWMNQGCRCSNPNDSSYPWYGQLGIKREWSSRECVNWYLREYAKRNSWDDPVVSRINDKGNYNSMNCVLKERLENLMEINRGGEYNLALKHAISILSEEGVDASIIMRVASLHKWT